MYMQIHQETAQREIRRTSIMDPLILTQPRYTAELTHLKCFQHQPPRCNVITVQNISESKRRVSTLSTEREVNLKKIKFPLNSLRM